MSDEKHYSITIPAALFDRIAARANTRNVDIHTLASAYLKRGMDAEDYAERLRREGDAIASLPVPRIKLMADLEELAGKHSILYKSSLSHELLAHPDDVVAALQQRDDHLDTQ